jgi:hypothetical protein
VRQVVKKNCEIKLHPDLIGIAFYLLPYVLQMVENLLSAWELLGERYVHGPRTAPIDQWLPPTWSSQRSPVFPVPFLLGLGRRYLVYLLFLVWICGQGIS